MPYLDRDGVKLYYEEAGSGEDAMLFVHGWCCNHTHFAAQVEHFASRFRCVSVDLRGHGLSDKPAQTYTIEGFADDLAWMCGELGLTHPIVIGHSMGGLTAFIMAGKYPDLVRAAVCVDAPLLMSEDALVMRRPILATFWGTDYLNAALAYADSRFFIDTDDPERRAVILEGVAAMPQQVLASAWQSILETDSRPAGKVIGERGIPLLAISAAQPLADLRVLRELCPQVILAQTAGSGHFCQMEVPEQVNAMIERFIKVALHT
jgi:pimeloyl-ACP methyl ester carboxylesterase